MRFCCGVLPDMGLIERLYRVETGRNDLTKAQENQSVPQICIEQGETRETGTCRAVRRLETSEDESQAPPDSGLS